jgi:hypothetical protein
MGFTDLFSGISDTISGLGGSIINGIFGGNSTQNIKPTLSNVKAGDFTKVNVSPISNIDPVKNFSTFQNADKSIIPSQVYTPQQSLTSGSGLSGNLLNGKILGMDPLDIAKIGLGIKGYIDQKKQLEKTNKLAAAQFNNTARTGNNALRRARGIENQLKGKAKGSQNERQNYDTISL